MTLRFSSYCCLYWFGGVSLVLSSFVDVRAETQTWRHDSNLKYQFVHSAYPANSVLRDLYGDDRTDHALSFRHNAAYRNNQWSAELSYQALARVIEKPATNVQPALHLHRTGIADDRNRFLDLSHELDNEDDYHLSDRLELAHKLDRLVVGYQSTNNVIKLGRQAISWGNGLIYNPMDFFNPFDPTAIDTEYKSGDDMLYAQHLFDSGNDLQLAWVARREQGRTSREVNSVAVKYHGFVAGSEIDILVAEHYSDTVFAAGGVVSLAGAVMRGDWVYTDTALGGVNSVVASINYSWTSFGRNINGLLEFFHNGFGVDASDYARVLQQPSHSLSQRLARGEVFTLGKNYLAGSASIEMTPLWILTPVAFHNLDDHSSFVQFISRHDIQQNVQLVAALQLPFGADGTEFGGIELTNADEMIEPRTVSTDWSVYTQLAWYF